MRSSPAGDLAHKRNPWSSKVTALWNYVGALQHASAQRIVSQPVGVPQSAGGGANLAAATGAVGREASGDGGAQGTKRSMGSCPAEQAHPSKVAHLELAGGAMDYLMQQSSLFGLH